jgi:hypothetical protein
MHVCHRLAGHLSDDAILKVNLKVVPFFRKRTTFLLFTKNFKKRPEFLATTGIMFIKRN